MIVHILILLCILNVFLAFQWWKIRDRANEMEDTVRQYQEIIEGMPFRETRLRKFELN